MGPNPEAGHGNKDDVIPNIDGGLYRSFGVTILLLPGGSGKLSLCDLDASHPARPKI